MINFYEEQDITEAIKYDRYNFFDLIDEYKTEEVYLIVLEKEYMYGWLPECYRNYEFHKKLNMMYPENKFYKSLVRKEIIKHL